MIDQTDIEKLRRDPDGLLTYEYIANHIDWLSEEDLNELLSNMINVDHNGQFLASASRYLNAIDSEKYGAAISRLVAATIDKDREHRYLSAVLNSIYGADCLCRAAELCVTDNNFRRIYKRLYPNSVI